MVTSGFYNSFDHDRRYNSIQFGSIFDGVVRDGIFMSEGTRFTVTADDQGDMFVIVGEGRAWFDHSWILNDAPLPIELPQSEIILKRIDAIVIETNSDIEVRENTIKVIKGTPSSDPKRPELIRSEKVNQYPLAFINIGENVSTIRQADITNMVGTSDTPFVTGILETMDIDELVAQWKDQFEMFLGLSQVDYNRWFDGIKETLERTENGTLLLQIWTLLDAVYKIGTYEQIDNIIAGTYVDESWTNYLFDVATETDIDEIIAGTYVEKEEIKEDIFDHLDLIVNYRALKDDVDGLKENVEDIEVHALFDEGYDEEDQNGNDNEHT